MSSSDASLLGWRCSAEGKALNRDVVDSLGYFGGCRFIRGSWGISCTSVIVGCQIDDRESLPPTLGSLIGVNLCRDRTDCRLKNTISQFQESEGMARFY